MSPKVGRRKFASVILPLFLFGVLLVLFSNNRHHLQTAASRFDRANLQQYISKNIATKWSDSAGLETEATDATSNTTRFLKQLFPYDDPQKTVKLNAMDWNNNAKEKPVEQFDDEDEPQQEEQEAILPPTVMTKPMVSAWVKAIMNYEDKSLERLPCRGNIGARYQPLRRVDGKIHYFFALDLHEVVTMLPTLLGSIVQVMRFLGPSSCTLSIIEGRSNDGTPEVLAALRVELERIGVIYHYSTSDIDPKNGGGDRMEALAALRNEALKPLIHNPEWYSNDANIIFLNDIGICPHDILELLYQQNIQRAHMTCGMDWSGAGELFYDIYIARSLVGESFFQIAQDGLWKFAQNLFWADLVAQQKYEAHQPFQVYACWNGGAVISAAPVMRRKIAFRRNNETESECYMGEPTLFCKDLWRLKLGRIQVVPTVNVGYEPLNATEQIKNKHGWVEQAIDVEKEEPQVEMIEWQSEPPSQVKCMRALHEPYWVPST